MVIPLRGQAYSRSNRDQLEQLKNRLASSKSILIDLSMNNKVFDTRTSILMGYTRLNERTVIQLLDQMGRTRFRANKYHLFRNNCNHFTNTLIEVFYIFLVNIDLIHRFIRTYVPILFPIISTDWRESELTFHCWKQYFLMRCSLLS